MRYKYLYSNEKGQRVKRGVFVSIGDTRGYFSVGWSQVNYDAGDVWDAKRAIDQALERARRVSKLFSSPEEYIESVPAHLRRKMNQWLIDSTQHYHCSLITQMPRNKDKQDLKDAKSALAEMDKEGSVPWEVVRANLESQTQG